MRERPSPTRIASVAFWVFFVLYTAGSIIWLLSGIPPILADRSLAVHETLHRWGASDRGYVTISSNGELGQRVTAGSRWVEAKELAVWANTPVVIRFENLDKGRHHNLAIYQRDGVQLIWQSQPTVSDTTEITFTAPPPGRYLFRDQLSPSPSAELVAVERDRAIPAWARWIPGLRTAAVGAAIESHAVLPPSEILLQYLFSALNIGLGILLIQLRPNDLAARLLALGMVGTAAVFNFPAHSGLQEMPWLARMLHDGYHLFAVEQAPGQLSCSAPWWMPTPARSRLRRARNVGSRCGTVHEASDHHAPAVGVDLARHVGHLVEVLVLALLERSSRAAR